MQLVMKFIPTREGEASLEMANEAQAAVTITIYVRQEVYAKLGEYHPRISHMQRSTKPMTYTANRNKLTDVSRALAKVALGEAAADLVIQNGTLVNVYSGELIVHMDVAIAAGRIAYIGKADHTIGDQTIIIDATGKYMVPGLLDGHMHVESTMLSVTEFAKAAIVKGTTGIFMDPHEIANVFGSEGVRLMHEEGQQLPLKVFTTFPSCVPATNDLEDGGSDAGGSGYSSGTAVGQRGRTG